MKISREKAQSAAEKIAAPLKQKISDYEKEMSAKLLAEYKASTPKEVLALFKKHPDFFKTESSVFIGRVGGAKYIYARFGESTPELNNFSTDARKREFVKFINDLETLHENYDKAVTTIKNTILSLGTVKKVYAEFPEAAPYIDMPTPNTAVALNIAPVRKLACGLIPDCKTGTKKP